MTGAAALWSLIACAALASTGGEGMSQADIHTTPSGESAAGSARDAAEMLDWVTAAFGGEAATMGPRVRLTVLRQDHSVLHFGQSCIDTPIRIGKRAFEHGLGTHANSVVAVSLPPDARRFHAQVGVDNNADNAGTRGSVAFAVSVDGKEALATEVLRGGQDPVAVDVPIPAGAKELRLEVTDGGDGAAYDQADWADAHLVLADGSRRYLDDNQVDLLLGDAGPPFSFTYGGKASSALLSTWVRAEESRALPGWSERVIRWDDPTTGLRVAATVRAYTASPAADRGAAATGRRVAATVRAYTDCPAADWVLTFENRGVRDTPVLDAIRALDTPLRTGYARRAAVIHRLDGDACGENSFRPLDQALEAGKALHLAPTGGRPSSVSAFPFWNVEYGGQGLITAVGWTGQWAADFERAGNGPTRMAAGMEKTHLVLRPGEKIRTPRIVVLAWRGDRTAAHNHWRRLLLGHYVPRIDGQPAVVPVALQNFDRYWSRPGWATEAGQIEAARTAHDLGCDTLWLDAAWFPGGFPNGVGSWSCRPAEFPRGLKPVSDECHRLGLKFVLWFEPERVAPGSEIAREHPEFVLGSGGAGLYNLGDPAARKWLTDLLSRRIAEYGIDWYRNDFNIDPLPFWRANDPPDRQGISEIRYVEGLYEMWDALRAAHPGLLIDNCASGGRRMDIEMLTRSVPLWRSDTCCSPGHADWDQQQVSTLSQYVPLFTGATWAPDAYTARSGASAGSICEWGVLEDGFSPAEARASIAEIKALRPFFAGDFYPLTPATTAADQFSAVQFHRPDMNAGVVLAFRRAECPHMGLIVGLKGLDPGTTYEVEFVGETRRASRKRMTGRALTTELPLRIGQPRSSLLVRYRAAGR